MKHMNFHETYLNESFFDDIEDDIFTDTVDSTLKQVNDITITSYEDKIIKLLNKISENRQNSHTKWNFSFKDESLIIKHANVNWATSLDILPEDLTTFQNVLDLLNQLNYNNIFADGLNIFGLNYRVKFDEMPKLDFHNIICNCGFFTNDISIHNVICNSHLIRISNCEINNIDIKTVDNLEINYVTNIKDFSFIKNISKSFKFTNNNQSNIPESHNFTGLPEGNYQLDIIYESDSTYSSTFNKYPKYKYDGINSLVGIPSSVNKLTINSFRYPDLILNHFSLEGLTKELSKKTNIKFSGFTKSKDLVVQVGPFKNEPKIRSMKISKQLMDYVVKTGDYYIECYLKETGPLKEYNPENVDINVLTSAKLKQQQKDDAKQDKELYLQDLIDKAKKYLTVGSVWSPKDPELKYKRIITIKSITDRLIEFTIDNLYSVRTHRTYKQKWEDFFKYINQLQYSLYNKEYTKSLQLLIIDPVVKKYLKLKELRKEERKKERAEVRATSKKVNTEETVDIQEEIPVNNIEDNVTVLETPIKKSSNIEIKDYSDKAIAIFGNTYNIKDKLKELGAKFNPYLKYNETTKKAGWIISKKKQKEVEDLINS